MKNHKYHKVYKDQPSINDKVEAQRIGIIQSVQRGRSLRLFFRWISPNEELSIIVFPIKIAQSNLIV